MDDLFSDIGIDPMLFFAMLFGGGPRGGGGIRMGMGPRGPFMYMSPDMGFGPFGGGGGPFGGGRRGYGRGGRSSGRRGGMQLFFLF